MGRPGTGTLSSFDPVVVQEIESMRSDQFDWGAKTLVAQLQQQSRFATLAIPSRSSIARFLKQKGFTRTYTKRSAPNDVDQLPKANQVHQRWQIDAKGNEQVPDVGVIGLINIKDVFSHIYTGTFPALLAHINSNPSADDYRVALRLSFCQYGLPEQIQCDHASIFYDNQHQSPFPTLFHLWLIALGIEVVFSRVRIPQDQAQVERQHLTTWLQIQRNSGFSGWLQLFDHTQNRRYMLNHHIPCRSLQDQPPLKAFPDGSHSGRFYRPESELAIMDLIRVDQFLAQQSWQRTVSQNGAVKIANQQYYLKRAGAQIGDQLTIKFDALHRKFGFYKDDLLLGHRSVKGLEIDNLIGHYPLRMPQGFQFQIPFDTHTECLLRLYETTPNTSL